VDFRKTNSQKSENETKKDQQMKAIVTTIVFMIGCTPGSTTSQIINPGIDFASCAFKKVAEEVDEKIPPLTIAYDAIGSCGGNLLQIYTLLTQNKHLYASQTERTRAFDEVAMAAKAEWEKKK
jgi:hypothetical protein